MKALVIQVRATVGQRVAKGETLVILEAMKMEHIVAAEQSGVVTHVRVQADSMVDEGQPLVSLEAAEVDDATEAIEAPSLDEARTDLAEVIARHAFGLDELLFFSFHKM